MGSVALAALVAVLAAGCGSGAKPEAKPEFVISASVEKTSAGTVHVSVVTELEGEHEGERFVVQRSSGEQDFRSNTARLKSISPLTEVNPDRTDIVVDAISIGTTTYQRIEGLDLPPGKEWVRIAPTDLGVPQTRQSIGSGDPADGLQFLEGVSNARASGSAEVRGVPTTKYRVTIDIQRLVDLMAKGSEKLSPGFADGLRELRDQIDLSRLPGAVWLDEAGRVRRFRLAMPIPGDNVSVVSTTEFYDFGAPVSISAPPRPRPCRSPTRWVRCRSSSPRSSPMPPEATRPDRGSWQTGR